MERPLRVVVTQSLFPEGNGSTMRYSSYFRSIVGAGGYVCCMGVFRMIVTNEHNPAYIEILINAMNTIREYFCSNSYRYALGKFSSEWYCVELQWPLCRFIWCALCG